MKIYLLTHEREVKRPSNTGNIILHTLKEISEKLIWQRKNPDIELLEKIRKNEAVLLFNKSEGDSIKDISKIENFVILDGTWQEAGKIYNKSPYLKKMKTFSIQTDKKSIYKLRRNQKEFGLCTAECVMEILRIKGDYLNAEKLNKAFLEFINYKKDE